MGEPVAQQGVGAGGAQHESARQQTKKGGMLGGGVGCDPGRQVRRAGASCVWSASQAWQLAARA